jgi:hypothetical protein
MENLQLMRPSQSKQTMLTPQWNEQIPPYNPSVQPEFAYTRVVEVVICDIFGISQSENMHFLAEVTQIQPCIAVSFLHHTVESTLMFLWCHKVFGHSDVTFNAECLPS